MWKVREEITKVFVGQSYVETYICISAL